MRQYDVFILRSTGQQVVVLQSDLSTNLGTCVVAPLIRLDQLPSLSKLRPIVQVGQTDARLIVERLAAIPSRDLGESVATAFAQQDEIKSALDMLFFGF